MIAHWSAGSIGTPSAAATAHASSTAARSRVLQGSAPRSSPTSRADAAVAAASGASRATFSQSTARSLTPIVSSSPAARSGASERSSVSTETTSEAAVILGAPGPRRTTTPGSSVHASSRPIAPATTVAVGACSRLAQARIRSTCSSPFWSGSTRALSSAPGAMRSSAGSRSWALTATTSSETGRSRRATASGCATDRSPSRTRVSPSRRIASTVRSVPDAEGSRERGDDAPDPAWAEHGDRCRRHASAGSITTFTYWVSE